MKRKLLIVTLGIMIFACLFAVSVFADANYSETVTLADGTVLSLWDVDGSGLIWYINGTDADTGKNTYACVSNLQQDSTLGEAYVKYTSYTGNTKVNYYMNSLSIVDENGATYNKNTVVVANLSYSNEKPLYLPNQTVPFNALNEKAFQNCTNLEYVLLPDNIIKVHNYCFSGCSKLKECDMSNTSLVEIGTNVFLNDTALISAGLPDTLESLSGNIFYGCTALEKVNGINSIFKNIAENGGSLPNGLFRGCTNLNMDIILYEGITAIGEYTFINCTSLSCFKELVIPNTVTKIGRSAFNSCTQIEIIRLGSSLVSFGGQTVFRGCSSVKTVYIPVTLAGVANGTFYGVASNCVFYYTGTKEQLATLMENVVSTDNNAFLGATQKSLAEFEAMTPASAKRYIVYDYNMCDAFYGSEHTENVECSYESYDAVGTKTIACTRDGCNRSITENITPLFTCLGYSAPENGNGGIAVGYTVNKEAVTEYISVTKITLSYGVFAVLKDRLGTNDIFAEDGTVANGVLHADITKYEFSAFEIKIVGFAEEQKETKLAMGAYVVVSDGVATKYSYMQAKDKGESNGNYYFVSFNDIVPTIAKEEAVN